MRQQYNNPKIPFTAPISGGLREEMTITVKGSVMPGASRFQVDFRCGNDRALHFNPRYGPFGANYVVCNTLQGSRWGWETWRPSPLPRGKSFTLKFLVNKNTYMILVNDYHFIDYDHRIPPINVDCIAIDGGVEIESVVLHNPAPPPYSPSQIPLASKPL